ncbi:MAG: dihydrodipicolinate synthase family protein [Bryobacteraceae bacterium]|nr:dihydrodipicolinate synthase family protein [Bryobacteraceae bacterium]
MPGLGIEGVYAAAITPRRQGTGAVDLGAMLEVIDFLCAAGVHGIALFGSTGEFPHFTLEERQKLIHLAVRRSRVPVIVNVSHTTLDGAVELANAAAYDGAKAVVLMPPYYFRYNQPEVRAFFEAFARETNGRLPRLLYNIPVFTSPIAADTARALVESGLYQGIKDSSGDLDYFRHLCGTCLVGNDAVFSQLRGEGATGVVSGVAAAVPELLLALDRAACQGDTARRARLDRRMSEFLAWLEQFPTPVGVKEAAALRKLKPGPHALPLPPDTETKLAQFREWFRAWLPEVRKDAA